MVEKLATTKTPIVFKSTGETKSLKHVKGDKWEFENDEIDPSILPYILMLKVGFGPDVIIFKEGKVFCNLWTYYGYSWGNSLNIDHQLFLIWKKYTDETHRQQIYVEAEFDSKNNLLKFSDETFGIFSCEYNKMTLSDLDDERRSLAYYELSTLPEGEDCHIFNNRIDGFQFIIDCAREKYGDVVPYTDNPTTNEYTFNLDRLEEDLKGSWRW